MRTIYHCNCCQKSLRIEEVQDSHILDGMCYDCFAAVQEYNEDLDDVDFDGESQ